ncbi:M20 aminoacylase family protein [Chelatococcus asaccharovorans]|uniref:Hippurate hydrolase n=1 Tax=Chelatococcus asaccharovorans TaxID=28210 RepID=A0A2V3UJS5_9HYPH|nr:M20 aminoacylase family protein [Chelatococcus asaccharovorans]MBS7701739.1 amidohydrolase [Chelatococcus asaccharovorans]PXW64554.1 hippurate hydrolase [Chelatococcus asaccharovorans]CAH1665138.1 Hippurate hydrolase [Chelatococcus asaccharovorans]CAH1682091.1 Hippurate hydrolase [Chelatococcus asaccharovorans]
MTADQTATAAGTGIIPRIAGFADEIVALRHDLHQHPEIGFEEVRTSEIVAQKLAEWGIEVYRGYGKTGVVGRLKGRHEGNRVVGLRADMDALPIVEATGLPYASVHHGVFHGCGHDAHTAILLGVARYLAETRDFAGTVQFIFQPAEEGLGGARAMLADGLFRDFPVDEIYGLHNAPGTYLPPGHLRVSPGVSMAAADFFDITLRGKGAHAAHPDTAHDPIPAVAELIQALQTIVSRNVRATDPVVLSITRVHGGTAYNVIPETVSIAGTVRAFSDPIREVVRERIRAISHHVAAAHGAVAEVEIRDVFSVLTNDPDSVNHVAVVARQVLGDSKVVVEKARILGSEDFADFLKHAPGAFFSIGHNGMVPLHNPGFILDDGLLPIGASVLSRLVESRLAAG